VFVWAPADDAAADVVIGAREWLDAVALEAEAAALADEEARAALIEERRAATEADKARRAAIAEAMAEAYDKIVAEYDAEHELELTADCWCDPEVETVPDLATSEPNIGLTRAGDLITPDGEIKPRKRAPRKPKP
jgi:hypothetical protein